MVSAQDQAGRIDPKEQVLPFEGIWLRIELVVRCDAICVGRDLPGCMPREVRCWPGVVWSVHPPDCETNIAFASHRII